MIKILIPTLFLLALASAHITIPITRRANQEPVINNVKRDAADQFLLAAEVTSQKMNVTVQNVKDLTYFGQIYVGNKTVQVQLDSGSLSLWLSSSDCVGCPGKNAYNCSASDTCFKTNLSYPIAYGLGAIEGYKGYEMVGFTPETQVNYTLIWAYKGENLQNYGQDVDGIMGFGPLENVTDYIELAYRNNLIQEKVFSFYLDHNTLEYGQYTSNSNLTIGYIPESKVNNLTWIPVTTGATHWSTKVYGMKIGDKVVNITGDSVAQEVMFDTGASFVLLSKNVMTELSNQLKDLDQKDFGVIYYRCDADYLGKFPNVTVSVQGMEIVLDVYSLLFFQQPYQSFGKNYCRFAVQESPMPLQLLGDAFLRNSFIAYSKRSQSIGLFQESYPIVLSPAPNRVWIFLALVVAIVLGVVALCVRKRKNAEELTQALKEPRRDVYSSMIES